MCVESNKQSMEGLQFAHDLDTYRFGQTSTYHAANFPLGAVFYSHFLVLDHPGCIHQSQAMRMTYYAQQSEMAEEFILEVSQSSIVVSKLVLVGLCF